MWATRNANFIFSQNCMSIICANAFQKRKENEIYSLSLKPDIVRRYCRTHVLLIDQTIETIFHQHWNSSFFFLFNIRPPVINFVLTLLHLSFDIIIWKCIIGIRSQTTSTNSCCIYKINKKFIVCSTLKWRAFPSQFVAIICH